MAIILPISGSTGGGGSGTANPYPKSSCATYIGYRNVLSDSANITQSDGEIRDALDMRLYTRWQSSGATATFEFNYSEDQTIDYIALYAYDLKGGALRLYRWDGSAYEEAIFIDGTVTAGYVIFKLFNSTPSSKWKLELTDSDAGAYIGALSAGEVLVMPSQQVGFTPPQLARDTALLTNVAETGIPLGRSILRKAAKFKIQARLISLEWALAEWLAFTLHAERLPFFFFWDVSDSAQAAYAWSDPDIPPTEYSTQLHLDASMDLRGLTDPVNSP